MSHDSRGLHKFYKKSIHIIYYMNSWYIYLSKHIIIEVEMKIKGDWVEGG